MATKHPRLGELLLARGVCSREQLREAWEQKVLYGDRLGTNLLALGYVDEHNLARALGQQHGVHSGHGSVIAPEPSALKLIPKAVAARRFMVPHHVVDKQLFLMMRDPHDAIAVDEAAFASGLRITPVVVCEARIWQLIELHYKTMMSLRPVPLDGAVPLRRATLDDASAAIALEPELTSEEEFQQLYANAHGAGAPAASDDVVAPQITPDDWGEDATIPARPVAIHGAASFLAPPRTGTDDPVEWRDEIEHTQPMMARPRFITEQDEATNADSIIDLVEVAESTELAEPLVRQVTLDFHVDVQDLVDETPLSFADATKVLHAATDRTAIARTVLRAARTRFARACLLTVYPDRIVGWMGIGEGLESERLRDVVISRSDKSVFALVAESRSHYLGPLARLLAHGAWVKATGRKIPKSLAVFPILVRGRPVNLLVVDNGHDQHVGSDVGEVLILAQQIAKTYETLLTSD